MLRPLKTIVVWEVKLKSLQMLTEINNLPYVIYAFPVEGGLQINIDLKVAWRYFMSFGYNYDNLYGTLPEIEDEFRQVEKMILAGGVNYQRVTKDDVCDTQSAQ